jgi:hypothetical protein
MAKKIGDASCVAVDKSLVRSLGPKWPKRLRIAGKVLPGVDRDSTWGARLAVEKSTLVLLQEIVPRHLVLILIGALDQLTMQLVGPLAGEVMAALAAPTRLSASLSTR